ncbi:hypothetical protein M2191_000171 [Bradyrhizobium japonicum]|nr:hypothetical protein [Bradyrhizobium japonicum]MCS3975488.1 hypothetical protein [Bradyrhizobium japonicum]
MREPLKYFTVTPDQPPFRKGPGRSQEHRRSRAVLPHVHAIIVAIDEYA